MREEFSDKDNVEVTEEAIEKAKEELKELEEIQKQNKKNNKKKLSKKSKIIIIISIVLTLIIIGVVIYFTIIKKPKQTEILITEKEYREKVDAYAKSIEDEVVKFMQDKEGLIPVWDDVKEKVNENNKDKVSCDSEINYDGSVYLENCKIEGIDYKSEYVYGEKLEELTESTNTKYINIYRYDFEDGSSNYYASYNYYSQNYVQVATYTCISESFCEGYNVNSKTKEVIIYDDGYYLYNFVTEEKEKLNFSKDMLKDVRGVIYEGKFIGAILTNYNNKKAYYSLETMKLVNNYIYDELYEYDGDMLAKGYLIGRTETNEKYVTDVFNRKTGGVVKSFNDYSYFNVVETNKGTIYKKYYGDSTNIQLFNSNFKEILSNSYNMVDILKDGTISASNYNDKTYKTYSYDGTLIKESTEYTRVKDLNNGTAIVVNNEGNLALIDYKLDEELLSFDTWTDNLIYSYSTYGNEFYSNTEEYGLSKNDEMLSIYVRNESVTYEKDGSIIRYYYNFKTKESGTELLPCGEY